LLFLSHSVTVNLFFCDLWFSGELEWRASSQVFVAGTGSSGSEQYLVLRCVNIPVSSYVVCTCAANALYSDMI